MDDNICWSQVKQGPSQYKDRLIYVWRFAIPGKTVFLIETAPWLPSSHVINKGCYPIVFHEQARCYQCLVDIDWCKNAFPIIKCICHKMYTCDIYCYICKIQFCIQTSEVYVCGVTFRAWITMQANIYNKYSMRWQGSNTWKTIQWKLSTPCNTQMEIIFEQEMHADVITMH